MMSGQGRVDPEAREHEGLLPGEWPDSPYPEDAEHWSTVYVELITAAGELAASADGNRSAVEAAQERYRRRLAFWRQRADELHQRRG